MRTLALTLVIATTAVGPAAADWPQFQGPDNNGIAAAGKLARSWPQGGPKVLWTVKLGPGYSGPAIDKGKVYVLDRVDNARDVLRCLDLTTGVEEWSFAYDAPGKLSHNGSRSTPAVDEKYVFTIGAMGQFHCIDKSTHKPVWIKDLLKDFGGRRPKWGVAQSPLLHKDTVIAAPLGGQVGVAAFAKATGRIVWKSPPLGRMEYASPRVAAIGGVEQVLIVTTKGIIASVEVGTGKVLWTYRGRKCSIPIPTPTPVGEGRVFITGGYRGGSVMLKVEKSGGKFVTSELFRLRDIGSILHDGLLYKGHLYAALNTKRTHDGLACIDLEGNIKWKTGRSPNFEKGNLIIADGVILIMDGKTGVLTMAEASPAGYKQLARTKVLGGREIWAPMAISAGKLVLRDQGRMKCLDLAAK